MSTSLELSYTAIMAVIRWASATIIIARAKQLGPHTRIIRQDLQVRIDRPDSRRHVCDTMGLMNLDGAH